MAFLPLRPFSWPKALRARETRAAGWRALRCHARYLVRGRLARSGMAAALVSAYGVGAAAFQLRPLLHSPAGAAMWVEALYAGGLLAALAAFSARLWIGLLRAEPRIQGRTALGDELSESWRAARGVMKAKLEASELSEACGQPAGAASDLGALPEPKPARKPRRL